MIKKEYMNPTMRVVKLQLSQIICTSGPKVVKIKSSGLDVAGEDEDDLLYDDFGGNGDDQGNAW